LDNEVALKDAAHQADEAPLEVAEDAAAACAR
jgi:hypothetical protein